VRTWAALAMSDNRPVSQRQPVDRRRRMTVRRFISAPTLSGTTSNNWRTLSDAQRVRSRGV
jgi:hypothetical protein